MRRQPLRGLEAEQQVERPRRDPARSLLRRAQWSAYYHRFFGRVRPGDRLHGGYSPPSLDDATNLLYDTLFTLPPARPPYRTEDRQTPARRCVSQMLLYGYRPSRNCQDRFRQLTSATARPDIRSAAAARGDGDASEFLVRWGQREFGATPLTEAQLKMEMETPGRGMISLPTRMQHLGGSFEVEKEVYLRTDLKSVSWLVNPKNWELMGQFFARTYREGERADSSATARATPWWGVLREDFIVTWNDYTTNVFRQRLKVDYTVTKEMARTDYALMYEEDDQIAVNDGFLELQADGPHPGWIRGRMKKRLRFTSSILNLMAPALLSMMLDSEAGGFNEFLTAKRSRQRR